MDKDRIVGSAKEAKGAVKNAIGKLTGDAKLQAEGKATKAKESYRTLSAARRTRSGCAEKVMCLRLPAWSDQDLPRR